MYRLRDCFIILTPAIALTLALFFWPGPHPEATAPSQLPGPALARLNQLSNASQPLPDPELAALESTFKETVHPFLTTYCAGCHGGEKPKGDFDLNVYTSAAMVAKDLRQWGIVLKQIETETMPPKKATVHPSAEQRKQAVAWIGALRKYEAKRSAGDPGPVLARRLSNAEYDYTIRDLTGVDIRPGKEFPVDPANEAGFDNSGESLAMSATLVTKYFEAARRVSEHLLLLPDGLKFAEYPVVADTDRDKFGVRQIIDFYKRQRTDYADYFQAAWRFEHRAALGQPKATLAEMAAKDGLSAKYLATIWDVLTGPPEELGPVAALRVLWKELPSPNGKATAARPATERMRDFVVRVRQKLVPDVKNLTAKSLHSGSQPLVLWKDREMAANRTRYAGGALKLGAEGLPAGSAAAKAMAVPSDSADVKKYEAAFPRFCATFPDAFFVSERARVYLDPKGEKKLTGRLLSAGFHSMTGYFRDDRPLYDLMLSQDEQRELDRLWLEFDVMSDVPQRTYTSMIWFERSDSSFMRGTEFDFARAEDKDCTSEAKIKKLSALWVAKAKMNGASEVALKAVKDYFEIFSKDVRVVEKARLAAEPKHVAALQAFAERAYRRPLTKPERDDIAAFYRHLRDKEGLSHEDAVRDSVVSTLVSPHFLFRINQSAPGKGAQPLTDHALANRLSYFLWSTMPDAELLARAAAGDLHKPEVLVAQAKRMVKDSRIRALATEFAGNWLDFRRFEEHNAVDRLRFKTFTDPLRQSMFEEPVRFVIDLAREDRSVLDLLYANRTFVNPLLAKHYGMPAPKGGPDVWVQIDDADKYGRGGLLPMAVFLTKNAPGLRTSPVKRGYWVVSRVLGEKIPAPPADVPDLPADESKLDLPLRDVLARHRADKNCAACHDRFDAVGLTFEGYGPVGELRTKDLGGRPVETHATFPGGSEGKGLDGLVTYLKEHRQEEFVDNFCRKLLTFALGRTLLPSDDALVHDMRQKLASNEYRFSVLVESIITSPQFLKRRGQD